MRPSSVTASRSSTSSRDGRVDARAGELVDLEALDDLPLAAGRGDRERRDDALGHAVGAVGRDAAETQSPAGVPLTQEDVVDRGVRGRGGRRRAARLDDRGAALGDGRDEVVSSTQSPSAACR